MSEEGEARCWLMETGRCGSPGKSGVLRVGLRGDPFLTPWEMREPGGRGALVFPVLYGKAEGRCYLLALSLSPAPISRNGL